MLFPSKIILASKSPRRKLLLEWAAISFEIRVSDSDESYPSDLPMGEVPLYIARNKALSIFAGEGEIVLAADTVVVLDNEIIGKPADRTDAVRILSKLSGKVHQVITGVVLIKNKKEIAFSDCTEVEFNELTQEEIEFYVDNYQPYDKAGAYAIQEWIGVTGIKKIAGDFYNVMGLPISRVVKTLHQLV